MTVREEFIDLYNNYIHREGADALLAWLETTDFFTAPASTHFHGAQEGGLCVHSMKVFKQYANLVQSYRVPLGIESWKDKAETVAVTALLHDVCKVGCYKVDFRNQKNEQGVWEKVPFYKFDEDNSCGGHGFKSVFIISDFMKLTMEERVIIANHMGAYDRVPSDNALNAAFEQYPMAFLLHTADNAATIFDEKTA